VRINANTKSIPCFSAGLVTFGPEIKQCSVRKLIHKPCLGKMEIGRGEVVLATGKKVNERDRDKLPLQTTFHIWRT